MNTKIKAITLFCSCLLPLSLLASDDRLVIRELEQAFGKNPANISITKQLLDKIGNVKGLEQKADSIVNVYLATQKESDYLTVDNWHIVKDYVDDIRSPYLFYVYKNRDLYLRNFSKDDVYQKLDDAIVNYLEPLYDPSDNTSFLTMLNRLKTEGYQHADVVSDYFFIRELNKKEHAEDYFYKARKLFRYFPENRGLIKKITADALHIIDDISHLKVIQLWAGKTIENKEDFEAYRNYALISKKCGYIDVARKSVSQMREMAKQKGDQLLIRKVSELGAYIG